MPIALKIALIACALIFVVCVIAFIRKTKLGGAGGYKDKQPSEKKV